MKIKTFLLLIAFGIAGCTQHNIHVDPLEVKPIEIKATLNINIKVVDKELDDVLSAEKQYLPKNPATAPTTPGENRP